VVRLNRPLVSSGPHAKESNHEIQNITLPYNTNFFALTLPLQLAAQQHTQYTVTFLGTFGGCCGEPFGLNNKGEVDGVANLPGDQNFHAFLWRKGVLIDLGTLGGPNSNGDIGGNFGPNERSEVVGVSTTSTPAPPGEDFCFSGFNVICLPFIWREGIMSPLPTLGGNNGVAGAINNRGEIVGMAENTTPEPNCFNILQQTKPVLWKKGEIQELPTFPDTDGQAMAINDLGQIVGITGGCQSGPTPALHGLLWENDTVTDLGNLGGHTFTFPQDINNQGEVVGSSDLPGDTFPGHAFPWTRNSGIQNLGTLPGDFRSLAKGINDKGQIVGQSCDASGNNCRAFLWQNGVMTDLNTLVPGGGSTFFMFEAQAINSRGQFVVIAFDANTGDCCAFLATPRNGGAANQNTVLAPRDQASPTQIPSLPENVRNWLRKNMDHRYRIPGLGAPKE